MFTLILLGFCFSLCLWFGLYLIARNYSTTHIVDSADTTNKHLIYTGLGLVSFAIYIAAITLGQQSENLFLERLRWALTFLPAIFWSGTLIELLADSHRQKKLLQRVWNYSVAPLSVLFFVTSLSTSFLVSNTANLNFGLYLFALLAILPLLSAYILLVKQQFSSREADKRTLLALLLVITLFFSISVGVLLIPALVSTTVGILMLGFDLIDKQSPPQPRR